MPTKFNQVQIEIINLVCTDMMEDGFSREESYRQGVLAAEISSMPTLVCREYSVEADRYIETPVRKATLEEMRDYLVDLRRYGQTGRGCDGEKFGYPGTRIFFE